MKNREKRTTRRWFVSVEELPDMLRPGRYEYQVYGRITVMRSGMMLNEDKDGLYPAGHSEDAVKRLLRGFGYRWDAVEGNPNRRWFDVTLVKLDKVEEGVWEFHIFQEWLD